MNIHNFQVKYAMQLLNTSCLVLEPLPPVQNYLASFGLYSSSGMWKFYKRPQRFGDCKTSTYQTMKTRVEAGSNTSTVNLRVVRGDEMGLKKAAP
jgi:hypothetical protein